MCVWPDSSAMQKLSTELGMCHHVIRPVWLLVGDRGRPSVSHFFAVKSEQEYCISELCFEGILCYMHRRLGANKRVGGGMDLDIHVCITERQQHILWACISVTGDTSHSRPTLCLVIPLSITFLAPRVQTGGEVRRGKWSV